jgi:hypothetical protein
VRSSEYEELKRLVDVERRGDDLGSFVSERLSPGGEFDGRKCEIYGELFRAGLIEGVEIDGGFCFFGLTQKGVDCVDDREAGNREEEERAKTQRRHDYLVASYGALAGGVLGFLGGALGSRLLEFFSDILM